MRKLTLFTLGMLFTCVGTLKAQTEDESASMDSDDTKKGLEISGSVDAYYRTTLSSSDNGGSSSTSTSFAGGTGFNIGMVNLVAAKEGEKAGFVADLVFGPRGDAAVFGSSFTDTNGGVFGTNPAIVNQLYAYLKVNDQLTLTLGNFNTFLGYEVISPTGNFNYSTSYMFSYGPFSHTGIKADYAINDEFSVMLAAMNPTDATETSPINNMTLGAQVGYSKDNGGAWLNFLHGNQGMDNGQPTTQIDLTTGWDVTDALYLGLNGTYNTTSSGVDGVDANGFLGAALYAQYALSETAKIGFRGEYFSEFGGGVGALSAYNPLIFDDGDANVIDLTLSGNITFGDLTLIPEVRMDMVSSYSNAGVEHQAFTDKDGEETSVLPSLSLAAIYAF